MITAIYMLVFCTLVPVSVYLLIGHRHNNLVFWGAITLLFAGLSGLQVALEDIVIPALADRNFPPFWVDKFVWLSDKLNSAIHSVPYWSILVFFLSYAGLMNKYIHFILPIPVWISIWNDKIEGVTQDTVNYPFILTWGIPYAACSLMLFLFVLFRERHWDKVLRHLGIASIYLLPETALILYQSDGWYISIEVDHMIYISVLLLFSALLVVTMYLRNKFLGAHREAVMGKIQIGTRLMQHAFKNSAGKIKLNALNIRKSLDRRSYEDAEKHLDYLLAANDHLLGMMDKLSYMTRNKITPTLEEHDLSAVVVEAAAPLSSQATMLYSFPSAAVSARIDKSLILECLTNIINNAIEAVGEHGSIEFSLLPKKTSIVLTIKDSGIGMDAVQLANITEPFYSTKTKSGRNFGLGMYYVSKVMEAHRGKLNIVSQPGQGTSVTLEFLV